MSLYEKGKNYYQNRRDFWLDPNEKVYNTNAYKAGSLLAGPAGSMGNALLKPMRVRNELAEEYQSEVDALDLVRPEYKESDAVNTMLGDAKRDYNTNRSSADAQYIDNIQKNKANSVHAASKYGGSGDVLATIAGSERTANDAYNNLVVHQENRRRSAASNYNRALAAKAQEEKNAYMYNQYQPYMMDLDRKYQLKSAADGLKIQSGDLMGQLAMEGLKLGVTTATEAFKDGIIG